MVKDDFHGEHEASFVFKLDRWVQLRPRVLCRSFYLSVGGFFMNLFFEIWISFFLTGVAFSWWCLDTPWLKSHIRGLAFFSFGFSSAMAMLMFLWRTIYAYLV